MLSLTSRVVSLSIVLFLYDPSCWGCDQVTGSFPWFNSLLLYSPHTYDKACLIVRHVLSITETIVQPAFHVITNSRPIGRLVSDLDADWSPIPECCDFMSEHVVGRIRALVSQRCSQCQVE